MPNPNLAPDSYLSFDGNCYGQLTNGQIVTITRNIDETKEGLFTREKTDALCHINANVRMPIRVRLYEEFLYLQIAAERKPSGFYPYPNEELSEKEIIHHLLHVLYVDAPKLYERTLMGSTKPGIENDPNIHTGYYVLNNGKEYRIEKQFDKVTIVERHTDNPFTYEYRLDWKLYAKSLELNNLSRQLTHRPITLLLPEMRDTSLENLRYYHALRKEISETLADLLASDC